MYSRLGLNPQVFAPKSRRASDSCAFAAGAELVEALAAHSTPVDCDGDAALYRQGEPAGGIYLVRQGQAALTMSSICGRTCLRLTAGAGSLLGLPETIDNNSYSLTAVAEPGSTVALVSGESLQRLMAAEADLSLKVLEVLAAQAYQTRKVLFDC